MGAAIPKTIAHGPAAGCCAAGFSNRPTSALGQTRRFCDVRVCPVYPKQQTFPDPVGTSHLCQKRTSNTSPFCPLLLSTENPASARQLRGATHGEAGEVKLGGFRAPTQDVSGASGAARNETTTAWAQGDAGETK